MPFSVCFFLFHVLCGSVWPSILYSFQCLLVVWLYFLCCCILNLFPVCSPVRVSDDGGYICMARNELGSSDEISAGVDVRYPPRNVRILPADLVDYEVSQTHTRTNTNTWERNRWVTPTNIKGLNIGVKKIKIHNFFPGNTYLIIILLAEMTKSFTVT